MAQLPDSVLSHVSIGTNQYGRAKAFYDAVLATLQIHLLMDAPASAGYGGKFAQFWVGLPHDGGRASPGNGVHVSFLANSIEEVKAFHAKAIELGGKDDGAPGYRGEYKPGYYAAFVRDLEGNKLEAMLIDPTRVP